MRPMLLDHDDSSIAPRAPYLAAAVAYGLGWLVLAWPCLSGRVTIPWDAKAQFLPQIQFLADSFARGESPFWNPFVFSGHPQVADPQSMIFSPPFFILALFNSNPSAWAVDVTVFVTILIGGLALIAWFRDRGFHPAGAVIAALAFGFGAAMSWRIQHTGQVLSLAMLPLVLLALDRALDDVRRSAVAYGIAAGVVSAAIVLGRDQVALLIVYMLAAYAIWRIVSDRAPMSALTRGLAPLGAGAIAGLVLIAIPILLTLALAGQSNRPEIDLIGAGRGSLHPASIITAFAPDVFGSTGSSWDYWGAPSFAWHDRWGQTGLVLAQNMGQLYIGAIPVLLILLGLGSGILVRREIVFFTVAFAVMTVYALGWFTPLFGLAHGYLPGVSLFRRPADAVFLMGFCGAILAGYAAHAVLTPQPARTRPSNWSAGIAVAAGVTLATFTAAIVLAVRMDHVEVALQPLTLSAVIVTFAAALIAWAAWIYPIRPVLAASLLIGASVADLAIQNAPGGATGLPPSTYAILDPATPNETIAILNAKTRERASATRRDRVELVGLGFASPNAAMTHRLESTLGYNPVRLGLYSRATGAGDTVGLVEDRKFSPMFPSYKSTLADLLGLAYIATPVPLATLDPQAKAEDFPLVAKTAEGYIYENPRAMPRAIFATSAAPADFDTILNTGTWPDTDLSATVLLSPDDEREAGLIATRGQGTVSITTYTNTQVVIEVESTRGGFVVLNDLWHPWWNATLDGQRVTVLRANVLVRAVRVPHGRHIVTFTFAPIAGVLAGR